MFDQIHPLVQNSQTKLSELRGYLKQCKKTCIAYSGGVDSSLVAAIGYEQLQENAIAVTGVSSSLAQYLLEEARSQAAWIGIKHIECLTKEIDNPSYYQNPINRCFTCKQELHHHIKEIAKKATGYQVIDGVNLNDLSEHRPGIEAAKLAGALSPLADLEIDKDTVREISKALGFPWWNKPAQPCLASRFPYGELIDSNRLNRVEKAELWLKNNGYEEVRVRSYGEEASIEVPINQIEDLILKVGKEKIRVFFLSIGFSNVSIDMEGLISGKLNRKNEQTSKN